MSRNIAIIQGHPDPRGSHYGHALAEAYDEGARAAGHSVNTVAVANLEFPLLRTKEDFENSAPPAPIREAQEQLRRADHWAIFYPLWHGDIPALLKGFVEQVFRPGFAYEMDPSGRSWKKLLKGTSARIVVTMGMPGPVYRWYFGGHSLKNLRRNILGFVGVHPIRHTLIGMVENMPGEKRERWLDKMRVLGRRAR